jgi:TolB-like protein
MSADPEQEYFSDGLSEEILNALAQIEGLRVISRTSAFAFKGKDVAIPEIARQLDVSHVLEGSVRSAGDDVRITAQLIEVNTDSHLWSQAFSRKLENVFDIQLEISRAIADQLQLRLAGSETQKPTNNLDAYRLYLQGRQLYQTRHSDALRRSIELLERAVDLDPEFDEAWANLAAASSVYAFQLDDGYREYQQRSRDAARRAIVINPDNGLARAVNGLAQISEIRVIEGIPELQRAIALNPNESNALLWMGIALSVLGYTQEAIDALRAAEAVDPVFVNLQNWLAYLHWQSGDAEGALRHEARARELNPDFPMNIPGEQYFFSGDLDAAERAWERSNSYYADALGESFVDINRISRLMFEALKNPARRDEAVREIQALAPRSSFNGVFIPLMRLGAVEEAMDSIRQTVADGRGLRAMNTLGSVWLAYDRKHLSHPAVMALFEELGFVDYWRAHGAPDFCRPDGDGFRCGEAP